MNAKQETDFQAWANLLIRRKVPDDYQHLISQEIIHDGEIILKRGDAFEIHIRSKNPEDSSTHSSTSNVRGDEILITPLVSPSRPSLRRFN